MGKHAAKGEVLATRSGIVVGTGKPKMFGWKFVLTLVAVLVLALGAGVAMRWYQDRNQPFRPKALPTPIEQAQDDVVKGDYDAARAGLQKELEKSNLTAQQKYDLYLQQATTYANQNKYKEAMGSYKQALTYKQTQGIYENMAYASEMLGDKQAALDYYKKAIQHISKTNPVGEDDKARYDMIISEIQAGTREL